MPQMKEIEIWKQIPHFENYEVSSLGRVRSWITSGSKNKRRETPFVRRLSISFGYSICTLTKKPKYRKDFRVHRLVLSVFDGVVMSRNIDCRHLDGNKQNNKLSNLVWGTRADNEADKSLHGKDNKGVRNGNSKLSENQIPKIRELSKTGLSTRAVAKLFGVTSGTIHPIIVGKTWRHVK
jgi:hypothetical protein